MAVSLLCDNMHRKVFTMHQETKSYILFLASQTGTDISKWNLLEIFGKSKAKMDKAKANKRFFEARELSIKTAAPATDQLANVSKDITTRTKSSTRVVTTLENKIKKNMESISDLHKRLEKLMSECVEKKIELAKAKKQDFVDLRPQIENILKEGWWTNPIVDGKHLWLHTNGNVIVRSVGSKCSCDDPTCHEVSDVPAEINFGKFAACINLDNLSIKVFPYENNLAHGGGFHMYVDENGYVCWGTAISTAIKLKNQLNLEKLMRLLSALLSSYDREDRGFSAFQDFVEADKLNIRRFYSDGVLECGDCQGCGYGGDGCENLVIVHPEFKEVKK